MSFITEFDEDELLNIPGAHGIAIMFCPNPACSAPHIVLFDENHKPIIHAALPDDFIQMLEKLLNNIH